MHVTDCPSCWCLRQHRDILMGQEMRRDSPASPDSQASQAPAWNSEDGHREEGFPSYPEMHTPSSLASCPTRH